MRRLTHILILAAFVFSCGGQWYVLQGIAWIKMIHDYAQIVPFTEAVGMTFSGKYPCALCKAIAEKKQAENDKICSVDKYAKKFFSSLTIAAVISSATSFQYANFSDHLLTRTESPPTPPPRLA